MAVPAATQSVRDRTFEGPAPPALRFLPGASRKVERLKRAGLLGGKPASEAAAEFNSMMEGLANAELRGSVLRLLPEGSEEEAWRRALTTVVRGFAASR